MTPSSNNLHVHTANYNKISMTMKMMMTFKKPVQEVDVTSARRPWRSEEEVALLKAYLHTTENKKHSNEQRKDLFWRQVMAHFRQLLGSTERNMDQMTSKLGDLNRKMSKLNGCFIQVNRNPQSGASEVTIMKTANDDYCPLYKKRSFPHLAAWEVARHHPKWVPVDLVDMGGPTASKKRGGSKRSKTSESGNYTTSASDNLPQMNLNDDPVDEPIQDDIPTRLCRKKSGDLLSKGKESVAESISEIKEAKLVEITQATERREKLVAAKLKCEEAYIRHLNEKEKHNDLKILLEPHTNLDEPFKSVIQQKREICEKWGWEMP
ncbi:uncharacterized protein LOC110907826 [Helianthus annuus]|uniref:uncharacterized protein LOC110907826 n=1 Tax=Helianthus annuus TaxID=4232 RepID=UPI000B8FE829|nr:uncharacterized protein LOC110907826 [Helianthus annuus]